MKYFGYEFEVPWDDLDATQTRLYPEDAPKKFKVELHFRSGLRLLVADVPPHTWAKQFRDDFGLSRQQAEALFGRETIQSDYSFVEALYRFTPDQIDHWNFQPGNRDGTLLLIKSIAPPKCAETGIFYLKTRDYRGFQLGDPQIRQARILVDLYSDAGSVEFIFLAPDNWNPSGITQPEINRIVQSLRLANPPETNSKIIRE